MDGPEAGEPRLLLTTWSDAEAAVVAQILEQEGIPCQVVSDVSHALLGDEEKSAYHHDLCYH